MNLSVILAFVPYLLFVIGVVFPVFIIIRILFNL